MECMLDIIMEFHSLRRSELSANLGFANASKTLCRTFLLEKFLPYLLDLA